MITLDLKVSPSADNVAYGLAQWSHLIGDYRPVFGDIRYVFNRHQRRHFDTEGASTGERWPSNWDPTVPYLPPPYDPRAYPAWKQIQVGHTKPLVFTGRLREAATGGAGALTSTTPTSMEMGVNPSAVPYAADHHRGNKVASALFGREVQLKRRPVIRFDGRPLAGKGSAFNSRGQTSFGYAVRQLIQAHIVGARRESLGFDRSAADATIARIRETETT